MKRIHISIFTGKFKGLMYMSLTSFVMSINGCTKFVQVEAPSTAITGNTVYVNENTAAAVMSNIYSLMANGGFQGGIFATGTSSIGVFAGLVSDELNVFAGGTDSYKRHYQNGYDALNTYGWLPFYNNIYVTNAVIAGANESQTLSQLFRNQLIGEAKFTRALNYFYLVNLWGDVPLITKTDYEINSLLPRSPVTDVYDQIQRDLEDAEGLLSDSYLSTDLKTVTVDRVRPTKWAAKALLARTYLYKNDWKNAESKATEVIANKAVFDTVSLNDVFLKNSKEAIWQVLPSVANRNTIDGNMFILASAPNTSSPFFLNTSLVADFTASDLRFQNWVKLFSNATGSYYYPFKYKVKTGATLTEYLMVFRLGELYLIRAEARANQDNVNGANSDVNVIRKRAGLALVNASSKTELAGIIQKERRLELFSEWGHRWFDLKRTGAVDTVMAKATPLKSGNWQPYKKLWPIQQIEMQRNPYMTQNPGY